MTTRKGTAVRRIASRIVSHRLRISPRIERGEKEKKRGGHPQRTGVLETMSGLSPSAVIVIAICASAAFTTILFSFARLWGRKDMDKVGDVQPRGREQEEYMRAVRQRNHHVAYAESLYGGPSRSSQIYSSVGDVTTPGAMNNPPSAGTPGPAGPGPAQRRASQQGQYFPPTQGGNNYVNYSNYEEGADYYDESPYNANAPNVAGQYYEDYSEQQHQLPSAAPENPVAASQSGPAR